MDKKTRYTQSSSKGAAPGDSKKNLDVVNGGKVFPKTWRRRESSGTAGCAKNEQQSRKSIVQKARTFDKRPKPKGQYHGGAKEDTKVEVEEAAELGSVMIPGSKKQNLNHLLNFHYAPRDTSTNLGGGNYGRPHSNSSNNNRWLPPIQRHKYNKEQFLQANCQFVVNNNGDYGTHLVDPDTLVDWKLIEQIRVNSSGNLSCPICLCPPVAGKMTRCGHVYCWPCILHYLALSNKAWRKCPICYESVQKTDLKSVVEVTQNHLNVGDEVKLRLMRRERGSLIAMPVCETATAVPSAFVSVSEANSRDIYSKLLLANIFDIMDIIESERVQLELELAEDPHSPENCFIEQALTDLSLREQRAACMKDAVQDVEDAVTSEPHQVIDQAREMKCETERGSEHDTNTSAMYSENAHMSRNDRTASTETPGPRALSKFFYFYQAEDGQHLYLHAMNIKMLELQYGNLENCPRTISGKILEKEAGSFTEELRRRMRYLYHLPLTCTFEIAEIELGYPVVSDDVLGHFAEQLENRERRRRRRERDERKREKKIITEENKRIGKFTTPKVHIESHKHFPQWQPEYQSSGMSVASPAESIATSSVASSPSRGGFFEDSNSTMNRCNSSQIMSPIEQLGPSFAQMLQISSSTGITRDGGDSVTWPSINARESAKNRSTASNAFSTDLDEDNCAAVPSYNQSFCYDLAQTLTGTDLPDTGKIREESNQSGKRKKKNKSTVLFATSMSRAS